uniref:Uncharacterized protein n=1 Tax=Rhizophora mucronata TaxID=61149 RepID=A0A2P2Q0H6_RHIMU
MTKTKGVAMMQFIIKFGNTILINSIFITDFSCKLVKYAIT